jgi:hypothetical protein
MTQTAAAMMIPISFSMRRPYRFATHR